MSGCSKFEVIVLSRLVSIIRGLSLNAVKLTYMFLYYVINLKTYAWLYLKKSGHVFFYVYRRETGTRAPRAYLRISFIIVKILILSYIIG